MFKISCGRHNCASASAENKRKVMTLEQTLESVKRDKRR
jgi:hypothetical protein